MKIDEIKEKLLGGKAPLKTAKVPTPEWASLGLSEVLVGELTGDELDDYDHARQVKTYPTDDEGSFQPDKVDHRGLRAILFSYGVRGEDGASSTWTDAELSILGKQSGAALDRCCDKISELSGMIPGAVEQAEKN